MYPATDFTSSCYSTDHCRFAGSVLLGLGRPVRGSGVRGTAFRTPGTFLTIGKFLNSTTLRPNVLLRGPPPYLHLLLFFCPVFSEAATDIATGIALSSSLLPLLLQTLLPARIESLPPPLFEKLPSPGTWGLHFPLFRTLLSLLNARVHSRRLQVFPLWLDIVLLSPFSVLHVLIRNCGEGTILPFPYLTERFVHSTLHLFWPPMERILLNYPHPLPFGTKDQPFLFNSHFNYPPPLSGC